MTTLFHPPSSAPARLALLSALLLALAWPQAAKADSLGCLIGPSRTADVGSPVIGVLEQVWVERGDEVKKGQVLATLRADVERAQLLLASSRANADGELLAAQRSHELATKKRDRADDLFRQDFISRQALDTATAEADVAQARLLQAREQARHSGKERSLAEAQLALRVIRSPIDGVVLERHLGAGERVDERPILKLASVKVLRAEVVLPAALYGRVAVGTSLRVRPELPGLPELVGSASVVDRVIDPASNTFRARVEMPNAEQRVPAGVRCKALIADASAAAPLTRRD
jgi:RND family efflux transporter MFP subunit